MCTLIKSFCVSLSFFFFFFNDPPTPEIYTLSLHAALPIFEAPARHGDRQARALRRILEREEHALPAGMAPQLGHLALDPERRQPREPVRDTSVKAGDGRSEEHTSELQSQSNLVCRLLLEKK